MRRESHVRFCEGGGVRLPSATRFSRSAALPVCHPERSWHFLASGVEGSTRSDFFFPARFQTNRFAAIPPGVRFGLRLAHLVGMTNKGARENRQPLTRGRRTSGMAICDIRLTKSILKLLHGRFLSRCEVAAERTQPPAYTSNKKTAAFVPHITWSDNAVVNVIRISPGKDRSPDDPVEIVPWRGQPRRDSTLSVTGR